MQELKLEDFIKAAKAAKLKAKQENSVQNRPNVNYGLTELELIFAPQVIFDNNGNTKYRK